MTEARKKPWLKWYPADWRAEPRLRLVSRAARSLWLDLIGLMHDAEPYGHLVIGGRKPSYAQLARILGDTEKEFFALVAELRTADVLSLTEDGTIFCRRMVRDGERSDTGREWVGKRKDRQPSSETAENAHRSPTSPPSRSPTPENDTNPSTLEARGQKDLKPPKGFKSSGPREGAGVREAPAPLAGPGWETFDPRWVDARRAVGEDAWRVYFVPCRPNGSATSIIAPGRYSASQLEDKFGDKLKQIFGERITFKLETKEPTT